MYSLYWWTCKQTIYCKITHTIWQTTGSEVLSHGHKNISSADLSSCSATAVGCYLNQTMKYGKCNMSEVTPVGDSLLMSSGAGEDVCYTTDGMEAPTSLLKKENIWSGTEPPWASWHAWFEFKMWVERDRALKLLWIAVSRGDRCAHSVWVHGADLIHRVIHYMCAFKLAKFSLTQKTCEMRQR